MEKNLHNMTEKTSTTGQDSGRVNRRDFFKAGIFGAIAGLTTFQAGKKKLMAQVVDKSAIQTHDEFPNKILGTYKRMDQRNLVFSRGFGGLDPKMLKYGLMFMEQKPKTEEGWTQLERALNQAAWSVHDDFSPGSAAAVPKSPAYAWEGPMYPVQYQFKDKAEASKLIKRAARHFGASLVGITAYDPRWVYEPLFHFMERKVIEPKFPFEPKSVIVMAIEMKYEGFGTAPSWIESATAGAIYSQMAVVAHSTAVFIRQLGYKAFGAGNDVAMSVPYAIAAGLGESGRLGSLITYEYGPRVRLCKVFTELELEYDKPITFGVKEFCKRCKRCAEACPSKAISFDTEPTFTGQTVCNNPGVEKWYMNPEKCFQFWGENGGDCGNCIAACPYNKPDMWHHRMITGLTKIFGGPAHTAMKQMDKIFGYGNTYDKKAVRRWWNS